MAKADLDRRRATRAQLFIDAAAVRSESAKLLAQGWLVWQRAVALKIEARRLVNDRPSAVSRLSRPP